MPTLITCTGLWTILEVKPWIRLNQKFLVEAEYLSPTTLKFSMPVIDE